MRHIDPHPHPPPRPSYIGGAHRGEGGGGGGWPAKPFHASRCHQTGPRRCGMNSPVRDVDPSLCLGNQVDLLHAAARVPTRDGNGIEKGSMMASCPAPLPSFFLSFQSSGFSFLCLLLLLD